MTKALRTFFVIVGLTFSALTAFAGAIRTLPDFQAITLPKGDDVSSSAAPLGFYVNARGWSGSSVYVNTNGGVTFHSSYIGYPGTPEDNEAGGIISPLSSSTQPIVSAFLADIDTSAPAVGAITYGKATLNGRPAFVVNYSNVAGYSFSAGDFDRKRNSFQIVLLERSDTGAGNFDIEFNYDQVQWESADSNGGVNGFGAYTAHVGYSNGTGVPGTFYELPGSGVPGSYPDGAPMSLVAGSLNSGVAGRYVFTIRNPTTPVITSLSPSTLVSGGPAFTLTLNGAGFAPDSTVFWNGSPVSTTFTSAARLTAAIPASLVAAAGTVSLMVRGDGLFSSSISFTIAPLAVTPSPAPAMVNCSIPSTEAFTACYYSTTTVTGTMLLARTEPQINLDGPPTGAVSSAAFSARWKGSFTFAQGDYVFSAIAADGMNIYIDGSPVLNVWMDQPATSYSVSRTLSAGQHLITVEYFQRHGKTSAHLSWRKNEQVQPQPTPTVDSQPPTAPVLMSAAAKSSTEVNLVWLGSSDNSGVAGYQIFRNASLLTTVNALAYADTGVIASGSYAYMIRAIDSAGNISPASNSVQVATPNAPASTPTPSPAPTPAPAPINCAIPAAEAFTACYYSTTAVTGSLLLARTEPLINLDGPPTSAVPAAVFSARWRGSFTFAQGDYVFSAIAADGMNIYIDGIRVLDAWMDRAATEYSVLKTLSAGQHLITVEYFQRHGKTSAHLSWRRNEP